MIQAMARWHSPMLGHYAGQAPLRAITSEFRRRQTGSANHSSDTARNNQQSVALTRRLEAMDTQ